MLCRQVPALAGAVRLRPMPQLSLNAARSRTGQTVVEIGNESGAAAFAECPGRNSKLSRYRPATHPAGKKFGRLFRDCRSDGCCPLPFTARGKRPRPHHHGITTQHGKLLRMKPRKFAPARFALCPDQHGTRDPQVHPTQVICGMLVEWQSRKNKRSCRQRSASHTGHRTE